MHVEARAAFAAVDVYAPASHGALCGSGHPVSVSVIDREAFGLYEVSEHAAHCAFDCAVPILKVYVPALHGKIGWQELVMVWGKGAS